MNRIATCLTAIALVFGAGNLQAAVISLNNGNDPISRPGSTRPEGWAQVLTKDSTSACFKFLDFEKDNVYARVEKEILPFITVGDTIFIRRDSATVNMISVTLHDQSIDVGDDVTELSFTNLGFYQASWQGQPLQLVIDRRQIKADLAHTRLQVEYLQLVAIGWKGRPIVNADISGGNYRIR